LCSNFGVYLQYYGLTEPPFDITPNPRFLFYSPKHREAFNHVLYGIRERKGFVQLTGEVGAGKTTLCRAILDQLDGHYATALILNPVMSSKELVKPSRLNLACRSTASTGSTRWRSSTNSCFSKPSGDRTPC